MKPIGRFDTRRNRVATTLANWCLRTFATPEYCKFIEGVIWYGMSAAAENVIKGKPAPASWHYVVGTKEQHGDLP